MRLTEIYLKEVFLREFWAELEENLQLDEAIDPGLSKLLSQANKIVFEKFGIKPSEKKYFIAGSARLYLYPELRDAFKLKGSIGDLDIVIPDKNLWINAGLENELEEGGIYRPTSDGSIEVFTEWNPAKIGGQYANTEVSPTEEILQKATLVGGYYYMSFIDIMDYKTKLSRKKEKKVVELIEKYREGSIKDKREFLRQIVSSIGADQAKELFAMGN
jgi:hypothetical protein